MTLYLCVVKGVVLYWEHGEGVGSGKWENSNHSLTPHHPHILQANDLTVNSSM